MFYNKRGDIVYKKMVYLADGSRVQRSVIGATVPECMYLMAEKEDLLLHVSLDSGEKRKIIQISFALSRNSVPGIDDEK